MIHRRHGETHEQFIPRLVSEIQALEAKCIKLTENLVDQDIQNIRNGNKYKDDAANLFHALTVVHGLLPVMPAEAKIVANEAIQLNGFNAVDISTGRVMDAGAYLNEKK